MNSVPAARSATEWFRLQDRLGWRVTKWSGCGDRKCRTCPRVPMERVPRWWNWYGKRILESATALVDLEATGVQGGRRRPTEESTMGIEQLRRALEDKIVDSFKVGDVVRWTSADRYTYAAIKTRVGWATTASPTNPFVAGMLDFEELTEALGRADVSDVSVATGWEGV